MAKILKCASNDDVITLEARDETDALTMKFEPSSACLLSPVRVGDGDTLFLPCSGFVGLGSLRLNVLTPPSDEQITSLCFTLPPPAAGHTCYTPPPATHHRRG